MSDHPASQEQLSLANIFQALNLPVFTDEQLNLLQQKDFASYASLTMFSALLKHNAKTETAQKIKTDFRFEALRRNLQYFVSKYLRPVLPIQPAQKEIPPLWGYLPNDLTRCNPFFPLRHNDLARKIFVNEVISSSAWGDLVYSGPQLSIYDEHCLMSILTMLKSCKNCVHTILFNDKPTFQYAGAILPLFRPLYFAKNTGDRNYKDFLSSIERMNKARLELTLSSGTNRNHKKRTPRKIIIDHIIEEYDLYQSGKTIILTINNYFYNILRSGGGLTKLDYNKLLTIRGAIAQSLYRFVKSHTNPDLLPITINKLASILNVNTNRPMYEIRRLLKKAIKELIDNNILTRQSGFMKNDIIKLYRIKTA